MGIAYALPTRRCPEQKTAFSEIDCCSRFINRSRIVATQTDGARSRAFRICRKDMTSHVLLHRQSNR